MFPTIDRRFLRTFPAGPQRKALDGSVPPTRPGQPDPDSTLRIRVSPAGPQLQALDRSGPRPRTASSGAERSPPDLNHKDSPKTYQIECQQECQKICQKECQKIWLISGCFLAYQPKEINRMQQACDIWTRTERRPEKNVRENAR